MVDEHDVRKLSMSLADVTENGDGFHFRARGTNMAWPYLERVHPRKARVPRLDIFVVRVANEDDKLALIEGEPDVFFTTSHYDGYPTVMVRLGEIDEERLRELLLDAHAAALATKKRRRNR